MTAVWLFVALVGENRTLTEQLAPPAIEAQPAPRVGTNRGLLEVAVTPVRFSTPVLVTVMTCAAEVAPTLTPPKSSEAGATLAAGATNLSLKASHRPDTGSLWMQNRRFSTFHSVS